MKLIRSKQIQKPNGRKKGKYQITLEVTDYDIEMFEEFGAYQTAWVKHYEGNEEAEYSKMNQYLNRFFFNTLHKLWRKYD